MNNNSLLLLSQAPSIRTNIVFPTVDILRKFKGNFTCYISGLSLPPSGGDRLFPKDLLFTPAYVIYNSNVRERIRRAYKSKGWKHFPINTYNATSIYHDFFPYWNQDRINDFLRELWIDDLIPVCSVLPDNSIITNPNLDSDLVRLAFWWEDPTPLIKPVFNETNKFWLVQSIFPKARVYWHNPTGQGAPYVNAVDWGFPPNTEVNHIVWQFMKQSGVKGLLFQGNGWESDGSVSSARIGDFIPRLKDGINGWPALEDGVIDFEEVAISLTYMNWSQYQADRITSIIRMEQPRLNGFCNG